jgi:hypothetical protein
MHWDDIRRRYPHQWLLVEAVEAHSTAGKRILEDLKVLETFPDGSAAFSGYKEVRRKAPQRELYVLHTDREALEVSELRWFGVLGAS